MLIYNINMKLTKENIQFIDNYLENSGVKYIDIRFEMTDHVATALEGMEGSFYDSFKSYMLQHKKELLQSNSKFTKAAGKRALKIILLGLLKPATLIVFILCYIILKVLLNYFPQAQVLDIYSAVYVFFMAAAVLKYKYFRTKYHKYSVIDKINAVLFTTLYVVFILIRPDILIYNLDFLIIYYSGLSAFFISSISAYKTLINKYKLQYSE